MKIIDGIARRARLEHQTPAEKAIRAAVVAVEDLGCDAHLTEAVVFLERAREKVADFVDGQSEAPTLGLEPIHARGGVVSDRAQLDTTIGPDGMQRNYLVLSDEERAKGFVRPVRRSYRHVGAPAPKNRLRDLTAEETERYAAYGYVKFEEYSLADRVGSVTGRFWTQARFDAIDKGCGTVTSMGRELAETYAREPGYYGSTFCCGCKTHLPVGKDGDFVWDGTTERVGT